MNKIDLLRECVFIRQLKPEIDIELESKPLNKLFYKVVENRNPDFKYEILNFKIENDESVSYSRVITENLFKDCWNYKYIFNKKASLINNEVHFESENYLFYITNFYDDSKELSISRVNKLTKKTDFLRYSMLIL